MIQNVNSIMWTERYQEAGEFEIIANLSSGLREFLPIGTFISHEDTLEVMFVENYEISEDENEDPTIKITGRSLEAYLENRIVAMNNIRMFPNVFDYILDPDYTWNQVVYLINEHIGSDLSPGDVLDNIIGTTNVTGTGVVEPRSIKRMDLYKAILELLAIDDLGIKTIRRNTFGVPDGSPDETRIVVYKGVNKSATVIFSWKAGDIDKAEYLWSDKKLKNSAAVVGRYVNTVVDTPGAERFNRRSMVVSADDIDGHLTEFPAEPELSDIISRMQVRGRAALDSQNRVTITRADISNVSKYQYRKDFEVGDLITLNGNFGEIAVMRVVEYVEIQDENGETGHPTLSLPDAQSVGSKYGRSSP